MEALLANVGYEVVAGVAAASLAAASVAVATVVQGRRRAAKRRREDTEEAETEDVAAAESEADRGLSPSRKKARAVPEPTEPATEPLPVTTPSVDRHGVPQEVVVATLARQAQGKLRNKLVYTFLDDRGRELVNYTFGDVDRAARRIAAALQTTAGVQKGDRVMLCYPPGLDFALGFWGCLYAGAIGIPVYPPYPGTLAKDLPKFNKMVEDSGARVILTNRTYHLASKMATVKNFFGASAGGAATTWPTGVQWLTTDALAESLAAQYRPPTLTLEDVAFFQYSSGSTSAPKAVMISHGNLRAQLRTWESIEPTDTLVSWLPSYHDMGLVGFIISPAVFGARCVSMSPISFIKDPAMWMRVASEYRATHVCAPNFGFALAARKTTDAQAQAMDLSTLKQAICAAEPIRVESLEAFTSKFTKASGFDPETFNCGYGLAEVTLVCTGQNPLERRRPTVVRVHKATLEAQHRAVLVAPETTPATELMTLVGCGKPMPTFSVRIVDPATRVPRGEAEVGEVWIQGPSVAVGYWNRDEYTTEMFRARLAGQEQDAADASKNFLRTGDMGFVRDGELFITGRLKDLIIIRGRNVCPQDVEATVERAHEHVRPGCVAAFSIEKNQEEALVVVAEVKNGSSREACIEICREITKSVLAEHQLRCEAIVLLRQKTIPKTTSGKIQRSAAKSKFLTNTLPKPVYEFTSKDKTPLPSVPAPIAAVVDAAPAAPATSTDGESTAQAAAPNQVQGPVKTEEEILQWLVTRLAQEIADEPEAETSEPRKIDPTTPWAEYGLDSVAIVGLSSELGEFLGCVVPPSAFFQFDTPAKLAAAPGIATGELETSVDGEPGALATGAPGFQPAQSLEEIEPSWYSIDDFTEVRKLYAQMKEFEDAGLKVPYMETLTAEKRKMVNFNTYNYLGNASNQEVANAMKKAVEEFGTTMSSSPIVGQHQLAVDLETALCSFFGAEAATLFVGGWVSNVTTIDALVGKGDLILCDALNHDSCVTGQRLSGATILPFPHNDTAALERMLSKIRMRFRRVLIVIEGVYSMDGDLPDLREMVRIKKAHKCMLFLDEAHSFGTMGKTGRGLCEHFDVDPKDVDVRMGTMSKALGSVGGFILGSAALAKYLKHCAGGFVFSVGLSPAHAGAAVKSLELMAKSPSRTLKLQERSCYFYDLCEKANLDMNATTFRGAPVVVVIIGSTIATAMASQYLAVKGHINVKPIVYPAVEEGKCRLRFFISSLHTKKQLEHSVAMLVEYVKDPEAAIKSLTTSATAGVIEPTNGVHAPVEKKETVTPAPVTKASPPPKKPTAPPAKTPSPAPVAKKAPASETKAAPPVAPSPTPVAVTKASPPPKKTPTPTPSPVAPAPKKAAEPKTAPPSAPVPQTNGKAQKGKTKNKRKAADNQKHH